MSDSKKESVIYGRNQKKEQSNVYLNKKLQQQRLWKMEQSKERKN